jgi:hypothetical protein
LRRSKAWDPLEHIPIKLHRDVLQIRLLSHVFFEKPVSTHRVKPEGMLFGTFFMRGNRAWHIWISRAAEQHDADRWSHIADFQAGSLMDPYLRN